MQQWNPDQNIQTARAMNAATNTIATTNASSTVLMRR
jgi:hypothetical protein